jgi:WD40 repeat protein
MKRYPWYLFILILILSSLLLDACSFSVEVMNNNTTNYTDNLSTPTLDLSIGPTPAPTFTPIPLQTFTPTVMPTPTLISIRADTIPMLEVVSTFQDGELARGLAFTPDGAVLASAGGNGDDFAIHLWDTVNGTALGTIDGHTGIIWDLAFSPNGSLLATVSSDGTAKIWDWRNESLVTTLTFPGQAVRVRFSPDGQRLAVGGVDEMDNQIQHAAVWTYAVGSWQPLLKFPEYIDITVLAYSPQGGTLIGGGTSRNVQVWQAANGKQVYTLNHAHQVSNAAVSPDGSTVATATCITVMNSDCTEGGIWLWNLPTGKLTQKLGNFPSVVESLAFSADGSTLVAGSRDGTVRFYLTSDYISQFEFPSQDGISTLAVSPDGGFLATANQSGAISLWKIVYHP